MACRVHGGNSPPSAGTALQRRPPDSHAAAEQERRKVNFRGAANGAGPLPVPPHRHFLLLQHHCRFPFRRLREAPAAPRQFPASRSLLFCAAKRRPARGGAQTQDRVTLLVPSPAQRVEVVDRGPDGRLRPGGMGHGSSWKT